MHTKWIILILGFGIPVVFAVISAIISKLDDR